MLEAMTAQTLWQRLEENQGRTFHTARGLGFTYELRGYEMFVSRKEKSITRATVWLAWGKARELNWIVTGPKKLGVFGASYLYPIFLELGWIRKEERET